MRHLLLSLQTLAAAGLSITALASPLHAQAPQPEAPQAQTSPPQSPPTQSPPGQSPTASTESATPSGEVSAAKPVDVLFESLKRERNVEKARGIANQIIAEVNDSGSATINLLMQWSAEAIKEKKNAAALDFLDRVTLLDPAYTEGWNRRATLHYAMGDRRKSMADIAEVLKREPRHFGALAGLAGILTESGDDELALKAWERYLNIYPADRNAQEAVVKLSEKIAGSRT